ncbi:hypothetical protein [Pseudaestuariivita rosea]|uniref:hypothetical protein n=1 Tax=Pseudaestuariivita rosea TaxID=2763263 RepID=UPI001ABBBA20|nr:hypothetical protein [Pseudaestuariivita rosea]
MFLELIGTFAAGFAAAGMVMLLNKMLGGRLPRSLIPISAGVAMLGTTISLEYNWYSRTEQALPEGIVVAQTVEETAVYRPWTYVFPQTTRFIAVDQGTARTNTDFPDQKMVTLLLFGRWAPVRQVPVVFDCANGRRADIVQGVEFSDSGALRNANWVTIPPDNPVLMTACAEV